MNPDQSQTVEAVDAAPETEATQAAIGSGNVGGQAIEATAEQIAAWQAAQQLAERRHNRMQIASLVLGDLSKDSNASAALAADRAVALADALLDRLARD